MWDLLNWLFINPSEPILPCKGMNPCLHPTHSRPGASYRSRVCWVDLAGHESTERSVAFLCMLVLRKQSAVTRRRFSVLFWAMWYSCNAFFHRISHPCCLHVKTSSCSPSYLLMGISQIVNDYTDSQEIPRLSTSSCLSLTSSARGRTGPACSDNAELSTSLQHLMNFLARRHQQGGHILFYGRSPSSFLIRP